MAFIVDILDQPTITQPQRDLRFEHYYNYLRNVRGELPNAAYRFATADWHYDFGDSRCPHDSWLEQLLMKVRAAGDRLEERVLDIHLRLLGPQHDGHIHLRYKSVTDFSLAGPFDWYYDELRLAPKDSSARVVHEIRGSATTRWLIECEDILYKWTPLKKQPQ
jgi:hypothetical protein